MHQQTFALLTGCAETGHRIWCAERYLPNLEKQPVMDNGHLRFAKHGYPYAVAASVVLERADDDTNITLHFQDGSTKSFPERVLLDSRLRRLT